MRRSRSTLALLLLPALTAGCASPVSTDSSGVNTTRCPEGGFSRCHDRARAFCGRAGYLTLSEVSDRGSKSGGADDSLISAREPVRILTFRCKGA